MKQYDAVVIGAGNGGLSAALTLAEAGKTVLVLEQHNLPGGSATSFVRGRFEMEAALHEFCAIGEPGKWEMLGKLMHDDLGLDVDWKYPPEAYCLIGKARSGKDYRVTIPIGRQAAIDAMEEAVPGSREPMEQFFDLCEECDAAYTYFDEHLLDQFDKDGFVKTDALYYMRKFPNFLKVAEQPFNKVLRKIGMPEDAIDILDAYWGYLGADYDNFSFVHQAWMFYMYVAGKPAYIHGTSHALTVTAVEKLRSLGSDLWLNVSAKKVTADDNGKITGVETSAGFVPANYVIANVNPHIAYGKLLDEKVRVPERMHQMINASRHGVRLMNVYLGLNKSMEEMGIDQYTYFCFPELDNHVNIAKSKRLQPVEFAGAVIYNMADPDISPKGTTMMAFTLVYTEDVWKDVAEEDYVKTKELITRQTIELFEKMSGARIMDAIEEVEIATPWTFCNYLRTPEGTCYGYENNDWDTMVSRLIAVKKDQPVHGFKTVGAAGARGDGYSQTYQTGHDVARLLLKEMKEDGRA